MRKYHTLLEFNIEKNEWENIFGDYDKKVVKQELQDSHDSDGILKKHLQVITTGENQKEIEAAILVINTEINPGRYHNGDQVNCPDCEGRGITAGVPCHWCGTEGKIYTDEPRVIEAYGETA